MNKVQRTTVKALFQRENGEIMIVKSSLDEYWELPGGKIEFGEQPQETLRREVKEELSINKFKIVDLLQMFSFESKDAEGNWQFIVSVFLCNLIDKKLSISPEHKGAKWIYPKDIRNIPMREGYYKVIEKL